MRRAALEKYVQDYCIELFLRPNRYGHKQKHVCVLTYNGKIVSQGVNINLKNDFVSQFNNLKCIHAEASAIMRAKRRHYSILPSCELWVARRGSSSNYSRPCVMCMRIIRSFGVPVIHYTDDQGRWVTEHVGF